jgi:DNA-binding beta-propeller fold protein YncE
MSRPYALLRAGFPYLTTLGMRRFSWYPVDVAMGAEGRLYSLNRAEGNVSVWRFNWDDDDLGKIGSYGSGDGQLTWPVNLILDRDENLYISDEALHRIVIFDREGNFLGKWGEFGDGEGQLNRPSGISFDADENVYVADALNHRVQKFTKNGEYLASWGQFGDGEGQLNMPWGITVDELGDVYVADWRNDRVQKFSSDGEFTFTFGSSGAENGQFNRPTGVTVDLDGDVYVVDWGNNRVQQFDATGRYLYKFTGDGTISKIGRNYLMANAKSLRQREMMCLETQKLLKAPQSAKVDAEGRLFIADYGRHRIQIYQKEAYALGPDQISPEQRSPSLIVA